MFDSFLRFYRIPRTLDTMIILFFLILIISKSFAPFSSSNHPIETFLTRVINSTILIDNSGICTCVSTHVPISPISLTVFRNFWILAVSSFFRPSIFAAGSITHERYIPFACDLRHSTIESNLSRDLRSPPRSIPRDPVTRRGPCTPRFFNTQTREKKREREKGLRCSGMHRDARVRVSRSDDLKG